MKKIVFLAMLTLALGIKAEAQRSIIDTTLYFDFDKYEVHKEYNELLSGVSDILLSDTTLWIEVGGHADVLGPKEYNQKLSLKRTETVLKYLHKKNISDKQIKGHHYGSSNPVASNDTKEGRGKNRRVELVIYRPENKVAVSDKSPEELPLRTEIDVLYNKEKFAYLDNSHRTIVHTVRESELIIDTNTFDLPVRSNLYKHEKIRLDFSEMDKKGEMLYNRVSLKSDKDEVLSSSYIMCLDSITNHGHAHIRKGRKIEFLIPEGFVKEGMNIYYSDDHDRKNWAFSEKPQYDSFHNCYVMHINNEGCFAVAEPVKSNVYVSLKGRYNYKGSKIKSEEEPDFFFVNKEDNVIVAADSAKDGTYYFSRLKAGSSGMLVGIVENDGNLMYIAKEEITVGEKSGTFENKSNVKFTSVNHFEMERTLLSVYQGDK